MAYTPGKGTTLKLSIASVYTSIAQVRSISAPQITVGVVETTHLTSTWRERLATIPDGGEVSMVLEWDPADSTHAQLWTNTPLGTVGLWRVDFTDTGVAQVAFSGIITAFSFGEVTVDDVETINVTITITGAVTITP